jgi:hypothetical protein
MPQPFPLAFRRDVVAAARKDWEDAGRRWQPVTYRHGGEAPIVITDHPHAHISPTNAAARGRIKRAGEYGATDVSAGHAPGRQGSALDGSASRRLENRYRVTPCRGFESHALRKQQQTRLGGTRRHGERGSSYGA